MFFLDLLLCEEEFHGNRRFGIYRLLATQSTLFIGNGQAFRHIPWKVICYSEDVSTVIIIVTCCGSNNSNKLLFSQLQLTDSCHRDPSIKERNFTDHSKLTSLPKFGL